MSSVKTKERSHKNDNDYLSRLFLEEGGGGRGGGGGGKAEPRRSTIFLQIASKTQFSQEPLSLPFFIISGFFPSFSFFFASFLFLLFPCFIRSFLSFFPFFSSYFLPFTPPSFPHHVSFHTLLMFAEFSIFGSHGLSTLNLRIAGRVRNALFP